MSRRIVALALSTLLLLFTAVPAAAQLGKIGNIGKKKEPDKAPPPGVDQAPVYTDKDKEEMAKIAQQKDVQDRIENEWKEMRRRDLDFAYRVNLTLRYAEGSLSDVAKFRSEFGQLYDNPMVERYVNGLGQRLVPKDSPNMFAFRVLLDPEPRAEAISTGTVYISTGLIAMLDNEAQLSYVLGHEIAHVERNHFYMKLRDSIIEEEYWKKKQESVERNRAILGAAAGIGGMFIGRAAGGWQGAGIGAAVGGLGGYVAGQFLFRNKFQPTNWNAVFEDEADEAGLKYMLDQNFDAREVPKVYLAVGRMVQTDPRLGLAFIGSPARVKERTSKITKLLAETYKADIDKKLKDAGLTGSGGDFAVNMSALKRDNGIIALDYDLFAQARSNLEEAVEQRSNDPMAHYYLGKVLALTGRTPEDKQQAVKYFQNAINYDAKRLAFADPHLDYALYLMSQANPAQPEVVKELKTFVLLYQRDHGGALPPNMHILYDYFLLAGDTSWYIPPVALVSTRYVDAVSTTGGSPRSMVQEIGINTAAAPEPRPAGTAVTPVSKPAAKPASAKRPGGQ